MAKGKPAASGVLIELAMTVLRDPRNPPAEVAYFAVILAWIAWNRSSGVEPEAERLAMVRAQLESAPALWTSFKYRGLEVLLKHLQQEKERRYPQDCRQIVKCQMSQDGVVRAEWIEVGSG